MDAVWPAPRRRPHHSAPIANISGHRKGRLADARRSISRAFLPNGVVNQKTSQSEPAATPGCRPPDVWPMTRRSPSVTSSRQNRASAEIHGPRYVSGYRVRIVGLEAQEVRRREDGRFFRAPNAVGIKRRVDRGRDQVYAKAGQRFYDRGNAAKFVGCGSRHNSKCSTSAPPCVAPSAPRHASPACIESGVSPSFVRPVGKGPSCNPALASVQVPRFAPDKHPCRLTGRCPQNRKSATLAPRNRRIWCDAAGDNAGSSSLYAVIVEPGSRIQAWLLSIKKPPAPEWGTGGKAESHRAQSRLRGRKPQKEYHRLRRCASAVGAPW